MKISPYFEGTKQLTALKRYANFTTARNRDWSIGESKLDMYRMAKRAFNGKSDEKCRRNEFDRIYGNLKSWWRISRNGSLASAETAFGLLTEECLDCSRSSGLTLMHLRDDSSQQIVVDCFRKVRELKKLKSGAFPVMAVSKFLAFLQPDTLRDMGSGDRLWGGLSRFSAGLERCVPRHQGRNRRRMDEVLSSLLAMGRKSHARMLSGLDGTFCRLVC